MGVRTAVVLGASGHVGQAVVRELIARDYRVTAASRRARVPALDGLPVRLVQADGAAAEQLADWVAGHDLVVDAAAPYPVNLFVPRGPAEVDPRGFAERWITGLIAAAERHGACLAHVGSFTTLPRPEAAWRMPSDFRRALHPYFEVKQLMEDAVLSAGRRGLPVVVVNPSACIGPYDGKPRDLCLIPRLLAGEVPATTTQTVNVLDVRDLATALCQAVEAGCLGQRIALCGRNVSAAALAERVCVLAGVAAPPFRVPAVGAAWMAYWLEAASAMIGRPSPAPSLVALLLCESYPMDPGPLQRQLGGRIRPLDESLRDAIAWYRRLGYC